MNLYEMFNDSEEPTLIDALRDFFPIVIDHLKLRNLPKIKLARNLHDTHVPTFGRFENDSEIITVDIENRHPNDILRTLAHELVHYAQGTRGMLDDDSWHTGSPEEDEANAEAGVIMRKFNTKFPKYLSLSAVVLPKNNINEGLGKSAIIAALASALSTAPAIGHAEPSDEAKALGIYRTINKYKEYDRTALEGEANQELMNILRSIQGHPNQSKLLPLIKKIIKLETEEELPPLTNPEDQQ